MPEQEEHEMTEAEKQLQIQEEAEIRKRIDEEYGRGSPEEVFGVHKFLNEVFKAKDSTKVGNLTLAELGMPLLPVRTHKDLELFSREVMHNKFYADYFQKEAENTLATSLSNNAKLVTLAVTTNRRVADDTKPRTVNKGWFGKKEPEQQ